MFQKNENYIEKYLFFQNLFDNFIITAKSNVQSVLKMRIQKLLYNPNDLYRELVGTSSNFISLKLFKSLVCTLLQSHCCLDATSNHCHVLQNTDN